MQTIRRARLETVSVASCPVCSGEHSFDFQAVIEERIGVMHAFTIRRETRSCAVICPDKGKRFMVDVPVTLAAGQTLVRLG